MNDRDQRHYRTAKTPISSTGTGCIREGDQRGQRFSLAAGRIFVFAEQIGWVYLQHLGDLLDRLQACVVPTTLEQADIGPMQLSLMGKVLLGNVLCLPCRSKIARKTMPYVHRTYHSRLRRILATEYTLHFSPTPHLCGKFHPILKPPRGKHD